MHHTSDIDVKGKGRTVKERGMPKEHSNRNDCFLFKRGLIFSSKTEHQIAAYQAFSYSKPKTALVGGQVLSDPEAKPLQPVLLSYCNSLDF